MVALPLTRGTQIEPPGPSCLLAIEVSSYVLNVISETRSEKVSFPNTTVSSIDKWTITTILFGRLWNLIQTHNLRYSRYSPKSRRQVACPVLSSSRWKCHFVSGPIAECSIQAGSFSRLCCQPYIKSQTRGPADPVFTYFRYKRPSFVSICSFVSRKNL